MAVTAAPVFREQLLDRRQRLEAVAGQQASDQMHRLIDEIDAALARIGAGTFGICETCHDPIEPDRLVVDPLTRYCLDHLTPAAQRALQHDLDMAARIQLELLPKADCVFEGWDVAYRYRPAGPVSGDYCDLLPGPDGDVYFLLGDVAGHGVSAAILMSHLSAMIRALLPLGLPLAQLMERTSRGFCESTLPMHYATLVCGRASRSGAIEICNAGHPPVVVLRAGGRSTSERVDATGLPIGLFCTAEYSSRSLQLESGDTVLLYTDGLVEAHNPAGDELGLDRIVAQLQTSGAATAASVVDSCLHEVVTFRQAAGFGDDLTVLAIRRLA